MKAGDRVVLTTGCNPASPEFPYQGTEFACGGEIVETATGGYSGKEMVYVKWDNAMITCVYASKLRPEDEKMEQTDPNIMFLHKKRGRCNEV